MKINGSQVSMKLVMRLQRPGPFVTILGGCGCAGLTAFLGLLATGAIPPFAVGFLAQALAPGTQLCFVGAAACATVAGTSRDSATSSVANARGRVLARGFETTAVIRYPHRHAASGALVHALKAGVGPPATSPLGALTAVDQDHVGREVVRAVQQRRAHTVGVDRRLERLELADAVRVEAAGDHELDPLVARGV